MHAVVEDRLAPGGVCLMTQQRSGGHWQSLDGGRGDGGSVIPRQAPRHGAHRRRSLNGSNSSIWTDMPTRATE